MKLIFLDFDGVLNCTGSYLYSKNLMNHKNTDAFYVAAPNPVSVDLVQRLITLKDVYCVISSSWRISRNIDEIKEVMITEFGFTDVNQVIGKTENLGVKRGFEIEEYLNRAHDIENYCIIDDGTDMLDSQLNNFVKTDYDIGFTFKDFQKVFEVLDIPQSKIII